MAKTLTLSITTKSIKEEMEFPKETITLSQLAYTLKKELMLQNNFDIFVKSPDNKFQSLAEDNFDTLFNKREQDLIQLIIFENFDLEKEVDQIFTEIEEEKKNRLCKSEAKKIWKDCCIKCNSAITETKFLCCICDHNIIFCHLCESTHEHPMIRYKTPELSTNLSEITSYITYASGKTNLKSSFSLLGKDIEISTLSTHPLTIRVNKTTNLLIKVKWNGHFCNPHSLIIKNYDDLTLAYQYTDPINKDGKKINKDEYSDLYISITPERCGSKYEIVVYYYLIKDGRFSNSLIFHIEVNEDEEEEKLNNYFSKYPEVVALPKKQKETISMIYKEKLSNKPIDQIYAILKKHKWVIEQSICDLTKDK